MMEMSIPLERYLEATKAPVYAIAKDRLGWLFDERCLVGIPTDTDMFLTVQCKMRKGFAGSLFSLTFSGLRTIGLKMFKDSNKVCDKRKIVNEEWFKYLSAGFEYTWNNKVFVFLKILTHWFPFLPTNIW